MIYNEAFDYLWSELANSGDAVARLKDYQRKRLRRALLARALKPYFLEAFFSINPSVVGATAQGSTLSVTKPLVVVDGAIRTTDRTAGLNNPSNNSFKLKLYRTASSSRVQIQQDAIKDEHLLTPWQCATRAMLPGFTGQGAPWPLTWPVPIHLLPNEVLQVQATVLAGMAAAATETTFCQFRAVMIDNQKEDDAFIADLRKQVEKTPLQRPVYLSLASEGARSILLPAIGASGQVEVKTQEASEHLLVTGYAALFARTAAANENGTTCNPKWRLQASDGHTFSQEEVDLQTYAYAEPGAFWQALPHPFLLPRGSSLSAIIDVVLPNTVLNATEQKDNYVFFRCTSV